MLINLIIGLPFMLLCLTLQVAVTYWSVQFYVGYARRTSPGGGLLAEGGPLLLVLIAMALANYVQIVIWGVLFLCLGEFSALGDAIYHSAVNFTSLGYGDVVMSAQWKMMGPLEAGNGVLMLGMTSGVMMAIMQHMIKVHFEAASD